jgi:hypothetical protein
MLLLHVKVVVASAVVGCCGAYGIVGWDGGGDWGWWWWFEMMVAVGVVVVWLDVMVVVVSAGFGGGGSGGITGCYGDGGWGWLLMWWWLRHGGLVFLWLFGLVWQWYFGCHGGVGYCRGGCYGIIFFGGCYDINGVNWIGCTVIFLVEVSVLYTRFSHFSMFAYQYWLKPFCYYHGPNICWAIVLAPLFQAIADRFKLTDKNRHVCHVLKA